MKIKTRYAPSPTGLFHVGSARTAIFNYLFAKKSDGEFILRIEDTDTERSNKKFEEDILDGLSWLGISWDGFFRQSERKGIYRKYIEKLVEDKKAYVSREESGASKEVIRFNNPGQKIVFQDLIRGEIEYDTSDLGNFVIAKDLDNPVFHFAVVIDDFEMGVSHVIRGEDHIANTPRQILIQQAVGAERPQYAHLPLILGPDRSKLSKRHGAESVTEFRSDGYLPEAMFNFLLLLGWHPKDEREIFSIQEAMQFFSLDRAQKGGAIFDVAKLDWMNGEYIKSKKLKDLALLARPYFPDVGKKAPDEYYEKILELLRHRLKKFSELRKDVEYFFGTPIYPATMLKWKEMNRKEIAESLSESLKIVESVPAEDFMKEHLEKEFLRHIGEGDKGRILWPLRVALSGRKASPGPFDIMDILGREESVARIKNAQKIA